MTEPDPESDEVATAVATVQITRLLHTYAERLDAGDLPAVAELFARSTWRPKLADGIVVYRGAAEVLERLRQVVAIHEDGTPRTRHVTTNVVVEVDQPRRQALARSSVLVMHALPGHPPACIFVGRYEDTFEWSAGEWQFVDRLMMADMVGDLSTHLRENLITAPAEEDDG